MLAAPAEAKVTWPKTTNVQPGAKLTVLHPGEFITRPIPIGLDPGTYRIAALGVAATVNVGQEPVGQ